MDPIGFGIGVIGLSGLYSTCVDLFKTIQGIRTFDREHRILATKLDIEKDLFLQWGERVGILNTGPNSKDPCLVDRNTMEIVCEVLEQLKELLADTRALERKYGMRAVQPRFGHDNAVTDNDGIVSRRRMSRFEASHREFVSRTRASNEQPSKLTRWRWVVQDKERFEGLLENIAYFVERLSRMVPGRERREMMAEDLVPLSGDPFSLRLIEEAAKNIHDDWSDAASTMADASEAALSEKSSSAIYVGSAVSDDLKTIRTTRRRRSPSREVPRIRIPRRSSTRDKVVEMMEDVFDFSRRR